MAEECTWQTVILIPKGKGDFPGIGLVQVLWKAVTILLNRRLTVLITYHNALHGFWAGWGAGTTTLYANLLQQLMKMRGAVLFKVFMDLQKAYDALDRERSLELLAAYGVGPRTL